MLGIGVFIGPPVVAAHAQQPAAFLLLWVLGGVFALVGALSVAELGAMMPRPGGEYPYLHVAYGPGVAFAAGLLQLLALFPGSLATMAVGTASFQLPVVLGPLFAWPTDALGIPIAPEMFWAAAIVLVLTALNHLGIVISGRLQVALTMVPMVVLAVASAAIVIRGPEPDAAFRSWSAPSAPITLSGIALAYLPVYFAFSGWNSAIFIGGEIANPRRNVPRALVAGTVGITLLYCLLCMGFLSVFSMSDLAAAGEAGTATARRLFGGVGELAITLLIVSAMLGSINGSVLTGSRIAYAMAHRGHCPAAAGRLSPRFNTPVVALWAQAGLTLVLMATQRFEQLLNYASSAMLLTGTFTVLAVIRLRRLMPDEPRPYRTWAYPWPILLYAVSSVVVLVVLIVDGDPSAYLTVAWFVLALALHRVLGLARRAR